MKGRSIVLSGDEVRAVLAGETQIRRVIVVPKNKPNACITSPAAEPGGAILAWGGGSWHRAAHLEVLMCPFGVAGDRLWVKEAWGTGFERKAFDQSAKVLYRADHGGAFVESGFWKSPITMPRWASRLTLEITTVRVEKRDEWEWVIDVRKVDGKQ